MPYQPPTRNVTYRRLVSLSSFERALKAADLSGTECAKLADTSPQYVNAIRRGYRRHVSTGLARRIEKALRVEPGTVFALSELTTADIRKTAA